jgi:ariadne-1
LKDNSLEKQLFEHHQEMLEKNTEKLQEYTEKNLDDIDRTQVVNLTRVTEKFMASLLTSMTGFYLFLYFIYLFFIFIFFIFY